ncbi:hypothetical protein V7S43_002890 [Phytophthora oleae]|uniref:PiggyBac transposable element-derived protein domain-containing protein n=1 Tax=Phytophthora oleae TaxID=2107226 RepID=A0ABD3FZ81_9STRA
MNIRMECTEEDPVFCYGDMMERITGYLNSDTVRTYLNVSHKHPAPWKAAAADVELAFAADLMKTFTCNRVRLNRLAKPALREQMSHIHGTIKRFV